LTGMALIIRPGRLLYFEGRPGRMMSAMPVKRDTVEDLVRRGARLVSDYAHVETSKTALLRDLADVVVDLRAQFQTEDSRTDWAGRGHAYRETVARIYSEAGIQPDAAHGLQAALRYHIGNVLRAKAPADELEALGLKSATPRERVKETRDRTAALARSAVAVTESTGNARADVSRLLIAAETLLQRVDEVDLASLPEEAFEKAMATLERILARATELTGVTAAPLVRESGRKRLRAV
jgi:hypothetical protein